MIKRLLKLMRALGTGNRDAYPICAVSLIYILRALDFSKILNSALDSLNGPTGAAGGAVGELGEIMDLRSREFTS